MTFFRTATVASLAVAAGLSAAVLAAPAQADPVNDQFLNDRFLTDLSGIGLLGIDPAAATSLGQQVCPMLAEPGQNVADVAAKVADEMGRPQDLGNVICFLGSDAARAIHGALVPVAGLS